MVKTTYLADAEGQVLETKQLIETEVRFSVAQFSIRPEMNPQA
jgi:hypothetical protein